MSANKVAACIITGDDYKEEEIKKLLVSLEPHVDGVFVNYNGTKAKLNWQKLTTLPVTYKKFKWEDDFSLARNQSFSLVPRDEYDWFLWIDTDDVLVGGPTAMEELFDSLDEYTEGVFLRYAYAVDPETNIVVVEQWRERILSTKVDWQWTFPIHEVCRATSGLQYAKRDQVFIEHQRKSGEDRGARERNRRIIARAASENPNEPRYQFYLAGETLAEADGETEPTRKAELIDVAIYAYEKYRSMVRELSDDVYLATSRMAELYRMKNDHAKALECDLESIAIYPDWPDGYVGAAKSCLELADWPRMRAFADMAMKCNKPSTAASIEPMMSGFTPVFLRGIANENLGDIDNAILDYEHAKMLWTPPGGTLEEKIEELRNFEGAKTHIEKFDQRKRLRGTKPEKSIAFFTQPIPEYWNPDTLDEGGHGGAETAIIKLAPYFAADGWRTVVFGNPGPYRGQDKNGVEWWDSDEYLPIEKFKTFISSRSVIPFDIKPVSDMNFLWMHDVNIGQESSEVLNMPDRIVAITNWHSNHLQNLYGQDSKKMSVIPNGIIPERFDKNDWENKKNNKFIYSSSPDRGLDTLLGMWPIIRERYPEHELHIYYGWEIIDKIIEQHRGRTQGMSYLEEFKNKCLGQIAFLGGEEGGIYQHGRVNQDQLAKEMAECTFWTYPTEFMETFCITAIEMQMAGVIPVTSRLAALNEVVMPGTPMVSGWPKNKSYQQDWLMLLASMDAQHEWQIDHREKARDFASQFTWESAYSKWNDLIKEYS